jgi:hypothetical protein
VGEKPNLREICSKFVSLPKDKILDNEKIIYDSLIAETIRLAINVNYCETIQSVHILYLRNWVIRKLRSLIPNIPDLFTMIFIDETYNGPNPIFLGDIIELSNGFYIPSPTRMIKIEENSWILISGLPTSYFVKEGFDIEVYGMTRLMKNITAEEINSKKIPIQNIDSYTGIDEINVSPEDFIESLIKQEHHHEWRQRSDWEMYMPKKYGKGGFCFSIYTGSKDLSIIKDGLALSLWKESREHQNTRYWLRIGKKLNHIKIDKKRVNGVEKFVTAEYEHKEMIKIQPSYVRYVCLALDKISGDPRKVYLKSSDETASISMDFSPPGALWRWFFSIGSKWNENPSRYIDLIIPKVAAPNTIKMLNRVGIEIVSELDKRS